MDREALEELKTLCTEIPQGPWNVRIDDTGGPFSGWPSVDVPDYLDSTLIHRAGFKQEYWGDLSLKQALRVAYFIAAARAAIPKLIEEVERAQWHAIETARKTDEILVTDGTVVAVAFWENEIDDPDSGRWMPGEWVALSIIGTITHWMPLPTPPALQSGGSNANAQST